MTGAREWAAERHTQALRASYTPDLGGVSLDVPEGKEWYYAIHIKDLSSVPLGRTEAAALLGMSLAEFLNEAKNGSAVINKFWIVINVGIHRNSMIPPATFYFDPSIHVAATSSGLRSELKEHLAEARNRLSEDYLWYEHEAIADLHASLSEQCKGREWSFHTAAANAHHFAFKASDACAHAHTEGDADLLSAFSSCAAMALSLEGELTTSTEWLWHAVEVASHRCIEWCKACEPALPR